jgi:DNA-directed RNA polymerase subunit RPC12/RpoP
MPRVGNVLGMSDADISTACDSCGRCQSLAEATVDESDRRTTTYRCRRCAHTILTVQTRGRVPWDGIGHLIRSWIIRNPRDLLLQADQMSRPNVLRAGPYDVIAQQVSDTQTGGAK